MMLSKEAQQAIEIAHTIKAQQADSLTAEQVQFLRADADEHNSVPVPANIQMTVINQNFQGEYYQLQNAQLKGTVLLFLHGGAYATGTVKSRRRLCFELLKRLGCDGLSVDYRQWPEAKHPAAQEDVIAAYHFLKQHYQHVLVFGESAGATLALTLTLQLKAQNEPLPQRIALFSPVITQLNLLTSEFTMQDRDPMLLGAGAPVAYFDQPAENDPLISPIYGDFSGFPSLMINCGSEEVKLDDSIVLDNLCQKAGVKSELRIWQGLFHVFVLFPMPETNQALDEITDFLKK